MDTQARVTMTVLCLVFCSCLSEEVFERQEPGTVPAGLGIGSDLVTGRRRRLNERRRTSQRARSQRTVSLVGRGVIYHPVFS
jgi:hypothetical protein